MLPAVFLPRDNLPSPLVAATLRQRHIVTLYVRCSREVRLGKRLVLNRKKQLARFLQVTQQDHQ